MKYLIFALMIISFVSIDSAKACSCAEWESASEMSKNYHAVVLAIPTAESVVDTSVEHPYAPINKTGMKVIRRFKGKYKKFFYLFTEKDLGGNCGATFKPNDGVYLIFAYSKDGRYYSDSCSLGVVDPSDEALTKILADLLN